MLLALAFLASAAALRLNPSRTPTGRAQRVSRVCAHQQDAYYDPNSYDQQSQQYGFYGQAQPSYVQATFDFADPEAGQLGFRVGDVIEVTQQGEPDGWWEGSLHGQVGWFPSTYCSALYYAQDGQYGDAGPQPYSGPKPPEHDVYDPRSTTQTYEQYLERAH